MGRSALLMILGNMWRGYGRYMEGLQGEEGEAGSVPSPTCSLLL